MRTLVEQMLIAQTSLRRLPPESKEHQELVQHLRDEIPAPVLAHFLRLVEQGKKGVAPVNRGVCSGCHLRLPSGLTAMLADSSRVHLCENCGAYLLLVPADPAPAVVRRPRAAKVAPRIRVSEEALAS